MKKALLRVLTVLMLVCFGAAVFTACGQEEPPVETVYKLTYTANGGVGADKTEEHKEGDKVTLKGADAFTREGYTLTAWTNGETELALGASFTMPAENVTLKAKWTENGEEPPATYTVTVTGDHMKATFDKQGPYKEGDVVKFSVAADEGYEIVSVKNGSNTLTAGADGKYSVTVAKANITVTVETKQKSEEPPATYTVTVTGDHAQATFDKQGPYKEGDVVTFSVAVDQGYDLVSVKNGSDTLTADGEGKYSVTVAKANITITVETKEHEVPPQTDPIEGVWTGTADGSMIEREGTYNVTSVVKKDGEKIHFILIFQKDADMLGMASKLPSTGEGVYGVAESMSVSLEGDSLKIIMSLSAPEGQTITLSQKAAITGTAPSPEGTYENEDEGITVTFGENPAADLGDGEQGLTLVPVGEYLIAYYTDLDLMHGFIIKAGEGDALIAITGETAVTLTKAAPKPLKEIKQTAALDFYADNFFKITVSEADLQWIQANVASVKVDGVQYPHGKNTGYLVDGSVIQIQVEAGAKDSEKQTFEIVWYGSDGSVLAKTTASKNWTAPVTYKVTVTGADNADVKFDVAGPYEDGTEVKFTVTAKAGYTLVSVKNGETVLQAGADGKYSVTIDKADIVITVETQEAATPAPAFTFEKGDATGEDPEIALGDKNDQGVYSVTLPESSYAAPANKYFRGWEIDGVTYYPGETYDVKDGDTVTLTAVWEDRVVKTTEENATIGTWNPNTIPHGYVLAENQPIVLTGEYETLAENGDDIWDGYVVEIVRPGESSYFVRPDGVALLAPWEMSPAGTTATAIPEAAAYKAAKLANQTKITVSLADSTVTVKIDVGDDISITMTITGMTLDSYVVNFAVDDATAKNAKVEYYLMYETPAISEETPLTIGTEENTIAYTANNPAWKSLLRKGEKLVLSGTMTSVANATTAGNYNAILAYLYSGFAPVAAIRSDDYIVDEAKMLAAENMQVAHTPVVQNADKHTAASEIENDNNFWASMRAIIANCTAEVTFDYTDTSKIVITFVYTGDDNKFTETYTFTATEGNTLKDEYTVGLGGDHNYTVINSLRRTSVKEAKEEVPFRRGEQTESVKPENAGNWYYYYTDTAADWNNWCAVDMEKAEYDLSGNIIRLKWNTTSQNSNFWSVQLFYENPENVTGTTYRLTFNLRINGEDGQTYKVTVNDQELTLNNGLNEIDVVYQEAGDKASFILCMGWGSDSSMVRDCDIEISEWKWEVTQAVDPSEEPLPQPTDEEKAKYVKGNQVGGVTSDQDMVQSGKGDAAKKDDAFMLWWVGDVSWNCGAVVTMGEHTYAKDSRTVNFTYSGGDRNFSVQLFYNNSNLEKNVFYFVSLKITATKDMTVTVNGNAVELKAGEEKVVEVLFRNGGHTDDGNPMYGIDIQFPGMTEETSVTVTDVKWLSAIENSTPSGQAKTIVPSRTNYYNDMYVSIFVTEEEFGVIQSADKVEVNGYTGPDWLSKGFEAVGRIGDGTYQVNIRISATKATAGEYAMSWMKGDAAVATYTYTLSE